jgi:hypothetical protein
LSAIGVQNRERQLDRAEEIDDAEPDDDEQESRFVTG